MKINTEPCVNKMCLHDLICRFCEFFRRRQYLKNIHIKHCLLVNICNNLTALFNIIFVCEMFVNHLIWLANELNQLINLKFRPELVGHHFLVCFFHKLFYWLRLCIYTVKRHHNLYGLVIGIVWIPSVSLGFENHPATA